MRIDVVAEDNLTLKIVAGSFNKTLAEMIAERINAQVTSTEALGPRGKIIDIFFVEKRGLKTENEINEAKKIIKQTIEEYYKKFEELQKVAEQYSEKI